MAHAEGALAQHVDEGRTFESGPPARVTLKALHALPLASVGHEEAAAMVASSADYAREVAEAGEGDRTLVWQLGKRI